MNNLQAINPEATRVKLTNIHDLVQRLTHELYQEEELSTLKIKDLYDIVKKIDQRVR